ncbi:MAG: 16S rRNA (uracil(1498)-N(3))-methyltransferase [Bacilli bacterium]|nr:16S rRNA (uracil(1498)-N(3))-methyltransferase [Bacilli bacterium]
MQRYFVNLKNDNKFILSLDDTYHITKVMRMNIGDLIEVVCSEKVYITEIVELKPNCIVEIKEEKIEYNELDVKVCVCQSLVKESKMDLILQKSTELGAYSFIPLKVKNSIIKGSESDFSKKVNRWQRIVKEASEQSKRNLIPLVYNVKTIKEIGDMDYDLKILCTVNELSTTLKNILQKRKNCGTMIIVVGPEGGFTSEEEQYLINKGFLSTSLGNLVLRTETASLCCLSMINYEFER